MLINEKIKIAIDNNGQKQLIDTMKCSNCRAAMKCLSITGCKLYNYLKQRLPSSLDENNVITIQTDDYDKAVVLIKRAIRLRKHRIR